MKRAAAVSCFFLFGCGALLAGPPSPQPASRERAPVLQELIRMTRAGSSDAEVLAYAKAHRMELPPEVRNDDLLWLRQSGVSDLVVGYMTAIDVRASSAPPPETVAYGSSDEDRPRRSREYSYPERDYDSAGYEGDYADRYAGSYPDSSYDSYPVDYSNDYYGYPYYSYPYYSSYYPYPVYFFVDRFGRSHRRGHRFDGHRGFDRGRGFRGHRGGFDGHRGSRGSWRDRAFSPRRGNPMVVGRGSGRPRGSVIVGPRGSGRPSLARGSVSQGFRGPRGGATVGRGFGQGFSGGAGSGNGFARAPVARSGGGRGAVAPHEARGRR